MLCWICSGDGVFPVQRSSRAERRVWGMRGDLMETYQTRKGLDRSDVVKMFSLTEKSRNAEHVGNKG